MYKKILFVIIVIIVVSIIIFIIRNRADEDDALSNIDVDVVNNYIRFGVNNPIPIKASSQDIEINKTKSNTGKKKYKPFESKGERECRRVLESHYKKPFNKTRELKFLVNPETNKMLELDCYNDDLKIAVEYNGIQHYKYPNHTKQTLEQFLEQKRRDIFKRNQCDKEGVYLITVPYTVEHDKIEEFILKNLPERYPQTPKYIATMETKFFDD